MAVKISRISALAVAGFLFGGGAAAQTTVFLDDFGSGTVGATDRSSSPYVPSTPVGPITAYFQYADTALGGVPSDPWNSIDDGYYAVLPPNNLQAAGAGLWWYQPPPRNGPIPSDHTTAAASVHDGNALVVNAGGVLNYFYRRDFSPAPGASYRISAWRYVVRTRNNYASGNQTSLRFEIQQVNSGTVINQSTDFTSVIGSATSDPPSDISVWRELSYEFRIPVNCGDAGDSPTFSIGLRNALGNTAGNDLLLDDVKLEKLDDDVDNTITCPTIIEKPYTVTAEDDPLGTVQPGSSTTFNPLLNDRVNDDGTGDVGSELAPGTVTIITPPGHGGTVTVHDDGTITYIAPTGYAGRDRFEYQICNNAPTPASCDTAWVTVTVLGPAAPVPTLSQWAMAALAGLLGLLGWRAARRSV